MLKCYTQGKVIPKLVPARPHRAWMDQSPERHPYRCLPLSVANTFGWELLSPCDVKIEWDGGPAAGNIRITAEDNFPLINDFAVSNFNHGIVTFHTGYLFVTDPGWSLIATGPFNEPREGMCALTGLIETYWLPYPFTMNWQLMRPGVYRLRKDEAFCHIMPVQVEPLLAMEPEIHSLSSNQELAARMVSYRDRRTALRANQLKPTEEGSPPPSWTREYFTGETRDGLAAPKHYQKIRLKNPVDKRMSESPLIQVGVSAAGSTGQPPTFGFFGYYVPPKK